MLIRRTAIGLVLALLVALPAPAWADFAQDNRQCGGDPNPDIEIGGCTRLIQSGRFNNKNLAITFNNRGTGYSRKGEYDRAIRDFDAALRLKPDDASAFYNRGNAYAKKGEYDRAIRDFDAALRLRPDDASAFYNRGIVYYGKGQYDQAIRDFTEAIRLKPDYTSAYGNRGLAYAKLRQRDKAIADYRKAIELRPGDKLGSAGLEHLGVYR